MRDEVGETSVERLLVDDDFGHDELWGSEMAGVWGLWYCKMQVCLR
jgi:hypothetical protein